jgi:hypothetical protein
MAVQGHRFLCGAAGSVLQEAPAWGLKYRGESLGCVFAQLSQDCSGNSKQRLPRLERHSWENTCAFEGTFPGTGRVSRCEEHGRVWLHL